MWFEIVLVCLQMTEINMFTLWECCVVRSECWNGLLLSNAEIKPISQCYTKYITNMSMSITVILQQHETINSLFPTQKQNTTWTHSFRGLYDFGTNYRLRLLRMPQLCLHLQVDWTSFMLFNWFLIELYYVFIKLS